MQNSTLEVLQLTSWLIYQINTDFAKQNGQNYSVRCKLNKNLIALFHYQCISTLCSHATLKARQLPERNQRSTR